MCQTVIFLLSIFFFALCDGFFWLVLEWGIIWAVLLALVLTIVFFVIAQMVWASMALKTKPNMKFDQYFKRLTLQKRKGNNALALEVEKYTPPKEIRAPRQYGNPTHAHSRITHASHELWYDRAAPKDCFELVYNCGDGKEFGPVKEIVLTPELVEEAKQNPHVKPFLDEEKGVLVLLYKKRAGMYKESLDLARKTRDNVAIRLIEAADIAAQQLDKEKCKHIHRWLCGKG